MQKGEFKSRRKQNAPWKQSEAAKRSKEAEGEKTQYRGYTLSKYREYRWEHYGGGRYERGHELRDKEEYRTE